MTRLDALSFDALDPAVEARFWAGILGGTPNADGDGVSFRPAADPGFRLRFRPTRTPKTGLNQIHFHLTSTSLDDQARTVARALELGAHHLDLGQRPEEGHVVLADPEDNEFDVIEPGNRFLEGCGFLAELAGDGSRDCGYFWSRALGWPLVWDQDEETAIRSPAGGPKISWGGPPLAPRTGRCRLRFDLVPADGVGLPAEVERLELLGAARAGSEPGEGGAVEMTDPDGHEFSVLPAQL